MRKAYLTIDDSPSARTPALVDFLVAREIPALLFARGDQMEAYPQAIVYAIENGFLIGNHSYAHIAAGDLSFEAWRADFEACEALIEAAYAQAGVARGVRTYRFPYIDRGDGVRVERASASGAADGGLSVSDAEAVARIQDYLRAQGIVQPFENMPEGYPVDAADSLFTYTSGDWMLTARHLGKHAYKCVADLTRRIDEDKGLAEAAHHHVLLFHDQAEIFEEVCALIDYMVGKRFDFLGFE